MKFNKISAVGVLTGLAALVAVSLACVGQKDLLELNSPKPKPVQQTISTPRPVQLYASPDGQVTKYDLESSKPIQSMPELSRSTIYGSRGIEDLLDKYVDLTGDEKKDLVLRYFVPNPKSDGLDVNITEIVDGANGITILRVADADYFIKNGQLHRVVYARNDELDLCNKVDITYRFENGQFASDREDCISPPKKAVYLDEKGFVTNKPVGDAIEVPDVYINTTNGTQHLSQLLWQSADVTGDRVSDFAIWYHTAVSARKRMPIFKILDGETLETIFMNGDDASHIDYISEGRVHSFTYIGGAQCWPSHEIHMWNSAPSAEFPNGRLVLAGKSCGP